jgi:hypothetical protein
VARARQTKFEDAMSGAPAGGGGGAPAGASERSGGEREDLADAASRLATQVVAGVRDGAAEVVAGVRDRVAECAHWLPAQPRVAEGCRERAPAADATAGRRCAARARAVLVPGVVGVWRLAPVQQLHAGPCPAGNSPERSTACTAH